MRNCDSLANLSVRMLKTSNTYIKVKICNNCFTYYKTMEINYSG